MTVTSDQRIQVFIDETKEKFGLHHYYLARHQLYRNINIFNETIYTLAMEWFPKHIALDQHDDGNPDGTAIIEMEIHSKKYKSIIFVGGQSYANGIRFDRIDLNEVIKWIEQETGLIYGKQFHLRQEQEQRYQFFECINGVPVSPSGTIEIEFDSSGNLTLFSVAGQFPAKDTVHEEAYTLSLEKIENIAKSQFQLVEFPNDEQEKLTSVYALEEIYVTNDNMSTIPFEAALDGRPYVKLDQTIYWESPANQSFEKQEIQWKEDISVDQAFAREPSPDSLPISKADQERCIQAIQNLLSQKYANDSGKWILKTLHRDSGYIHATLTKKEQGHLIFKRKLTVIIDASQFHPVNFIDNKPILEIFDNYQRAEKVTVTKEEAFEKIKEKLELKPCYVYNFDQKKYVLCGKLDCQYGVDASSGEVIALADL